MIDNDLIKAMIAKLEQSPESLAAIDAHVKDKFRYGWIPNPGPQTDAYYSQADILLYGGAAGGGKSDLIAGLAAQEHTKATIYRLKFGDLTDLVTRLQTVMGGKDGWNGQDYRMKRGDHEVYFEALDKPGAEDSAQGRARDLIAFDEGAQITRFKFRFVQGWLRSTKEGQRCRVIIASNPPLSAEGEWLIAEFAPWLEDGHPKRAKPGELRWAVDGPDDRIVWLDGPDPVRFTLDVDGKWDGDWVAASAAEIEQANLGHRVDIALPKSRTFIPAHLRDNDAFDPAQRAAYMARLQALPEPYKSKLIKGDFLAGREDQANQVIPTEWVEAAMARWKEPTKRMIALGIDVARGGKDNTVAAPLHDGDIFGNLVSRPGRETREADDLVSFIIKHRRGKAGIVIDCTGGWGDSAKVLLNQQGIEVKAFIASGSPGGPTEPDGMLQFKTQRGESWWRMREALDPARGPTLALPPDAELKAELISPTYQIKGTVIYVETKDELRVRLGRSTDKADAVLMAWLHRLFGIGQWQSQSVAEYAVQAQDPFAIYEPGGNGSDVYASADPMEML